MQMVEMGKKCQDNCEGRKKVVEKNQLITIAESSWNMSREQGRGKGRDLKGE